MNRITDPLVSRTNSERLRYSTGELLGADDFRDEQTYHRRQIALALLHLHGSGTIAGLRVLVRHLPASATNARDEVELHVRPGLAIDHSGRLVEVPLEACLRLRRWFEYLASPDRLDDELNASNLRAAWRVDATGPVGGAVVADVFLAFHPCPRGYTPAFASGPFDALDASQPSRIRDAYELSLVLRSERDSQLRSAADPWPPLDGATVADRLASLADVSREREYRVTEPAPENAEDVDPTALLLARLRLPAEQSPDGIRAPIPDWRPASWTGENANLDNRVRRVVLPPAALRRVLVP